MTNTTFNNDLRLLSNRKFLELQNLSKDAFIARGESAVIERKYKVIIEALEGLYDLNIQHSCSLIELINSFDSI
jgi:hypothetical protein